jgi:hypothetical protein
MEIVGEDGNCVQGKVEVTKWFDVYNLYQDLLKQLENYSRGMDENNIHGVCGTQTDQQAKGNQDAVILEPKDDADDTDWLSDG